MLSLLRLFAPPDAPAGGGGSTPPSSTASPIGKEEMIQLLGDDDPAEKETIPLGETETRRETIEDDRTEKEESQRTRKEEKTEGEEDEKDDEVDELKELEEELEGPTEEQLELMSPVSRREILKKYPNLFKDFPYLERSYYREREYTELLPTVDDAREAVHKSKVLDALESDVNQGNLIPVLSSIAKNNPDAMAHIADNYMSALAQADNGAYLHVLGNINKHLIAVMVREGKASNNEALVTAAQIVNQFVFGSSQYTPPTNLAKQPAGKNGEPDEQTMREQQFARQQFDSTVSNLNDRVNNVLKNTIEANIDPRGSMTDFVKKNASREVMENLETLVAKDTRFKALTDRLWQAAIASNYSKESVDKIKSAYLAKAKSLLPPVIKKARNEALKGMGKRVERDEDTTPSSNGSRGPITPGRPRSSSGGKITSAKDIPRGMSTIDFLNSD